MKIYTKLGDKCTISEFEIYHNFYKHSRDVLSHLIFVISTLCFLYYIFLTIF